MNKLKSNKGFTIIEVVLVLAIAGLIFLMVFVALPRLQVSQRDTQRRDDVAAVATAITQYQSNNGGKLPSNATSFGSQYLSKNGAFIDPNGDSYRISIQAYSATNTSSINALVAAASTVEVIPAKENTTCTYIINGATETETLANAADDCPQKTVQTNTTGQYDGNIFIVTGAGCGEDGALTQGSGGRSYAVGMALEGAGYYCTDN